MGNRSHYGAHSIRPVDSVNLNRCEACGTNNPTLPGSGLPTSCNGCGGAFERDEKPIHRLAFQPPKAGVGGVDDIDSANSQTTQRRRGLNKARLLGSLRDRRTGKTDNGGE